MGLNLRTPGPTPLPPAVREALGREMIAHRGADFAASLKKCVEGLQWAFQTRNDIVILTASGTGGLESLAVNTLSPGQRLLAFTMGYFGDRMVKVARTFGADVVQIEVEAGQAIDPQLVYDKLQADPTVETVFVTHNETSTGVLNPLKEIGAAVRQARPEALLLVDGISSIGSVAIEPEAWGCDVVVAGSQKGWMIPPGLTFVSISQRAWERQAQSKMPKVYFDWQAAKKSAADGGTPWTPAVNLFFALEAALDIMRAEGLQAVFDRHIRLAEYVRGGLADLGMRLLADPRYASPTVTTAFLPDGVEAAALLSALEDRHGIVMAGGQGKLEGRVVRVGHMGWVNQADLAAVLHALQVELTSVRTRSAADSADANSQMPAALLDKSVAEVRPTATRG